MAESNSVPNELEVRPNCIRCGSELGVSPLTHWQEGWWTCSVCNVRWEA